MSAYGRILSAMVVTASALTALSSPAGGMPILTVVGRGNGLFEVQGEGLEGVGGITMTLGHDQAAAATPRVTPGELFTGALLVPNLTTPGMVKLGIISPHRQGVSGKGSIARLSLSPLNGTPANVTSFTAQVVSAAGGADIPAQTAIRAAGETVATVTGSPDSAAPGLTAAEAASAGGMAANRSSGAIGALPVTGPGSGPGSVVSPVAPGGGPQPTPPPAVSPKGTEDEPVTVSPEPVAPEAGAAVAGAPHVTPPADAPRQIAVTKSAATRSVLDLFREQGGERSLTALGALFASGETPGARQEPTIALSDGRSTVTVTLTVTPGASSPNFALSDARLVRLGKEGDHYLLEVRPDTGVNGALVTLQNNGSITVFPLTVAQPLDPALIPGGILSESAVELFLKGAPGKRKDLNGDGVIDYLDDYIIMANYLAGKKPGTPKTPASK